MRRALLFAALAIGCASPASGQATYPPIVGVPVEMQAAIDAAKLMAMQANAKADDAATKAAQAQTAAATAGTTATSATTAAATAKSTADDATTKATTATTQASSASTAAAIANTAAANAKTAADLAKAAADAATAAIPPVCSTAPRPDTLTGTVGTMPACAPRADAAAATVIQAKNTTTLADATYSITFDAPFASVPIYADARVYGQTTPYMCTVNTLTTTTAAGKCYQLVSTTLPNVATALLGLVVSPVTSAAAGLSVRVVARQ